MKAAELRQSILQMASTGELTAKWRKKRKKSEKWLQVYIEDYLIKGRRPMATGPFGTMIKKSEHCLTGIPVLGIENIGQGKFIPGNKIFVTPQKAEELRAFALYADDVIISRSGTVGELCLVPADMSGSLLSTNLMRVTLDKEKMIPRFFIYLFQSKGIVIDQVKELCRGSTRVFLNQTILKQIVFPLPPLAEQQRIVAKVDELMAMCNELEAAEKELDILENHFIEYLPKTILHIAVQGKTVPQDLHDEPASDLLERIKAKKVKLIKEGKIKKEKPLPSIVEDEIPYDLPDGWVWCRLGEVIQLLSGRDLDARQFNDTEQGVPYITGASAIDGDSILISRWTEFPSVISQIGDLLVSCKGTVGKMAINEIGDCHIARQIMSIRFLYDDILPNYIALFIKSYVQQLVFQAKSIIPGISREHILLAPLPLPPLAEQQRIVSKVDELMGLCNELKSAWNVVVPLAGAEKIVPFPSTPDEEPLRMVAQGTPAQAQSAELHLAIDDLFGDDDDE